MKPTRILLLASTILIGTAGGLGAYTFVYARGASYLTDDPRACANCHVMNNQYDGWIKSSHRDVATCNDCHTPHNVIGKYAVKAKNGFLHSMYFTLGGFHEPIQISGASKRTTEGACRHCHADLVHSITPSGSSAGAAGDCTRCHASVGHWSR